MCKERLFKCSRRATEPCAYEARMPVEQQNHVHMKVRVPIEQQNRVQAKDHQGAKAGSVTVTIHSSWD